MEQVVNFDNARMLDNYRKILDEKKKGDEKTVSELRNLARRRVLDGISVKTMSDISGILKLLAPIRYTWPDIYEQEKTIEIPYMLGSLSIADTPKSRSDLVVELSKLEIELAKEINPILGIDEKDLTLIEQFTRRYALDYKNSVVIDLEIMGVNVKIEGFKLLHADQKIYEGKKEITMPEHLLKHSLLKCVEGYTNDPQMPAPLIINPTSMKTTYICNNWRGFRKEVTEALPLDNPEKHCAAILDHILTYSVNGHKDHGDTSLNYMAHLVQKPWEKPGWAILYRGNEGCGKDVIARYLGKMLHPNHWIEISDDEFKSDKTAWRKGRVLVNVTEFNGLDFKSIPRIYPTIEANEARIREMYMDIYTSKSIERFILTTNRENAIPAKLDTRRFFIPEFNDCLGMNHEDDEEMIKFKNNYFDKLYREMGGKDMDRVGEGVIAFYQYLKGRDISKFDIKHPRLLTRTMGDLIEANRSTLDIMIDDIIYTGQIPNYSEGFEPAIPLNKHSDTIIEGSIVNTNYRYLYERVRRERGHAHPSPGRISSHLVKGLGLPWESDDSKNNRAHYKMLSKNNSLNYIFPPLTVLRDIYFKNHPRRKRPPE